MENFSACPSGDAGGVGDPRPASAEKGERLLDASADHIAAQVAEVRALRPFEGG